MIITLFTSVQAAVPRATSRWHPNPADSLKGAAPPCLGEGVLALCPAWEEGWGKEEVAPTPSFQEPLAQPSAPNPGHFPQPREARLGCSVPASPLFSLASLTLRNGLEAPGVGMGVGDSETLSQAERADLRPSNYTPLALGRAARD